MTPFNSKLMLIVDCVISWVEIVVVLIIDSIITRITVNGTSKTSLHFFMEAIMCMRGISQKDLIVFLSLHLAAHSIWLITLLIMVVGMFMFQSPSTVGFFPFSITTFTVSLLDLASTIYFAVETSKVFADCCQSLFFPLFFSKGVLLWIVNIVIAVHVLTCRKQFGDGEIKEGKLSRQDTVYSLPWDSYTDLLIPPPLVSSPEVLQPRSIMKNPNNPNYQSRPTSVKFRGSTSTEYSSDPKVETDLIVGAFRSAVRYPDVTEYYRYWDSYVHASGKPSDDSW